MPHLVHITTLPQSAATFLNGQLSWLRERGLRITVMSSPGAQLVEFARQEQVEWSSVPLTRSITPVADLLAVRQLEEQLRRLRPDIVHAHTPKAGLVGMAAACLASVPVRIYHLHGLRFETCTGLRRRLLSAAERMTCAMAHRVLCVSPSVKDAAIAARVVSSTKARVLANGSINGLDTERFCPGPEAAHWRQLVRAWMGIPADALCLGFVGRLVRDKGVVELHQAWQTLRQDFPQLHLLLVGPFETADAVPDDVRTSLQNDPRVHLTGLDWNVRPYYAAMDLFALPTHREGLGTVLLEAAAMELPIVTTHCTGCVDAVNPQVTELVPVGDANSLTAALRRLLNSPAERQRRGRAGRQFVLDRFQPQAVWQAVWQEYIELLGVPLSSPVAPPHTGRSIARRAA